MWLLMLHRLILLPKDTWGDWPPTMMHFGLSSMKDFHSLVWLYSFWLVICLSKTSIHTTTLLTGSFIVSSISWCISTINPAQWVISGLGNLSRNWYALVLVSLMVHLHWDNKNRLEPFKLSISILLPDVFLLQAWVIAEYLFGVAYLAFYWHLP